jgi:hypothetical protein
MSGELDWLVGWYTKECRSDDKKSVGILIETFDNPGWGLTVDLENTTLNQKAFNEIDIKRTENDWIQCGIKDNKFDGAGGPLNLIDVLTIFREWVENINESMRRNNTENNHTKVSKQNDLHWLMQWFYSHCDGDWEHSYGAYIKTSSSREGSFTIEFENTELEGVPFTERKEMRSKDNWIHCYIENNKFEGRCGPQNLPEVLKIFREWAESVPQWT